MLSRIAKDLGAAYDEVLTGFKWIANKAMEREALPGRCKHRFQQIHLVGQADLPIGGPIHRATAAVGIGRQHMKPGRQSFHQVTPLTGTACVGMQAQYFRTAACLTYKWQSTCRAV